MGVRSPRNLKLHKWILKPWQEEQSSSGCWRISNILFEIIRGKKLQKFKKLRKSIKRNIGQPGHLLQKTNFAKTRRLLSVRRNLRHDAQMKCCRIFGAETFFYRNVPQHRTFHCQDGRHEDFWIKTKRDETQRCDTQMKSLDEYIPMILFVLLLKRVHFLVNET